MTAARPEPRSSAAADLRAGVSELADVLFRLDTSPELSLVRDRSQLKGRSAARAADVAELLDRLWLHFPVLKEAADGVDKALAEGDRAALTALLDGAGVALPDGSTTSAPELLARLRGDANKVNAAVTEVATAWRNALPRLDALTTRLQAARAIAEELGMPSDPELAAARSVVDDLVATATADPLGAHTDVGNAEQQVERSVARLEELRRTKATIGTDLDTAEERLEQLAVLIGAGAGARAAAEARIEGARGLVASLDPSVLDTGDRALRPWLARLRAQAAAGAWPAAAESLEDWQQAAGELQARATAVAATNRAPLERRNDLRGLLDAYRAKAAAIGLAEDATLTGLYRAAHDALYAYRCNVQQAEIRVREYGRAIGAVQ